jgi:hypothetical protein
VRIKSEGAPPSLAKRAGSRSSSLTAPVSCNLLLDPTYAQPLSVAAQPHSHPGESARIPAHAAHVPQNPLRDTCQRRSAPLTVRLACSPLPTHARRVTPGPGSPPHTLTRRSRLEASVFDWRVDSGHTRAGGRVRSCLPSINARAAFPRAELSGRHHMRRLSRERTPSVLCSLRVVFAHMNRPHCRPVYRRSCCANA